ncbi:7651_t:CDS:2 [Ambispora leptoticha]|uniref:7651_t:CDS:1 n=1 Tax=Ambispora leptoticha TaxID=144679 RepID=A0A9N9CS71_9GLOM|nr:7651_t:CDS:2 [Ambispora leptoticha]
MRIYSRTGSAVNRKAGLGPKEYHYAAYAKHKDYQPGQIKKKTLEQITQLLQKIKPSSNLEAILEFELPETSYSLEDDFGLAELNLAEATEETISQIEIPPKGNN